MGSVHTHWDLSTLYLSISSFSLWRLLGQFPFFQSNALTVLLYDMFYVREYKFSYTYSRLKCDDVSLVREPEFRGKMQ